MGTKNGLMNYMVGMRLSIMGKVIIIFVLSIINALMGFLALFISPLAIMFGLNLSKGHVNNPDGELFMPLGWIVFALVLSLVAILGIVDIYTIRKHRFSVLFMFYFLGVFLLGAIVEFLVIGF